MLRAHAMPSANNTALQQGKGRFDSVGMNISLHVDTPAMANCLVLSLLMEMPRRTAIHVEIVRHQNVHVVADIFADVLFESPRSHILGVEKSQLTLSLTDSDYDFLVGRSASSFSVSLAAHVGFVHFDNTAQPFAVSLNHRCADSVAEIPRGFVGHSERALNLAGGHSFLGLTEQQRGEKPLPKGEMRIVEYRPGGNAKLIVATVTIILKAIGDWSGLRQAARALWAFRPAKLLQDLAALLVTAKPFAQFGHVDVFRQ